MKNINRISQSSFSREQGKNTNIWAFLEASRYLLPMNDTLVVTLAKTFEISENTFKILLKIYQTGGGAVWN